MELRHLSHFVAVAEEGSFTRASERLGVVQSAVSATIRALERELDVELFERTTQHVALSDAGHVLLPEARATLAAAAAARDAIDEFAGGLRGTLTIGTMQALKVVDVPALLVAFTREHPHVDVRVLHARGGSAELAERLRHAEFDIAFLALPERRPAGIEFTVLAEESIELACRTDHPLASRRALDLADLADETFIDTPPGWGTRVANDRAFAQAGTRRTVSLEVDDVPDLLAMVRAGLGVALIPPSLTADRDGIHFVPIRRFAPTFQIAVATPALRRPSAAARALLQVLGARSPRRPRR
jgi:DNA-binding transcriptional LysR family regulator